MLMTMTGHSWLTMPYRAVGSHSADYIATLLSQLYSRCMARQGQDNRMLRVVVQFRSPDHAPILTTPDTLLSVLSGLCNGPKCA